VRLAAATTSPYPPDVRRRVMDLFTRPATTQQVASIHFLLGDLFADAARTVARAAGCWWSKTTRSPPS
jgi:hypothetical protein